MPWYGLYEDDVLIETMKSDNTVMITVNDFKDYGTYVHNYDKSYKVYKLRIQRVKSNVQVVQLDSTPEDIEQETQAPQSRMSENDWQRLLGSLERPDLNVSRLRSRLRDINNDPPF